MSHIPNNAMPHAGQINQSGQPSTTPVSAESESGSALTQLADKAREYPKTAIAAGAAVAAGVVAAAALGARSRSDNDKSGKKGNKA